MTPAPGRYALDTNVLIAVLNEDASVVERWSSVDVALLPAPVLGELLYGALRSSRPNANTARIRDLAGEMQLVPCGEAVCEEYARLRATLAAAGRPIPENDVWVAACAVAADAVLVTRDAHFEAIAELACEKW